MGGRTNVFSLAGSDRPRPSSIEPRIRPLVDALNETGLVYTFTSCEGHYGRPGPPGDPPGRERANVGFFLLPGVPEQDLVRFFGKVLAGCRLHASREVIFEVAKRYAAALDGSDAPEVFFDFTIRPVDAGASPFAKRNATDRALAAIARSVTLVARPATRDALVSPRADIGQAVAAHGRWKSRFAAAVASGAAAARGEVEEIEQDGRCEIGLWLHGTPELRAEPSFAHVVALHARFHREASRALRLALAKREGEARRLIDAGSAYSRTSTDLVRALESWAA